MTRSASSVSSLSRVINGFQSYVGVSRPCLRPHPQPNVYFGVLDLLPDPCTTAGRILCAAKFPELPHQSQVGRRDSCAINKWFNQTTHESTKTVEKRVQMGTKGYGCRGTDGDDCEVLDRATLGPFDLGPVLFQGLRTGKPESPQG